MTKSESKFRYGREKYLKKPFRGMVQRRDFRALRDEGDGLAHG